MNIDIFTLRSIPIYRNIYIQYIYASVHMQTFSNTSFRNTDTHFPPSRTHSHTHNSVCPMTDFWGHFVLASSQLLAVGQAQVCASFVSAGLVYIATWGPDPKYSSQSCLADVWWSSQTELIADVCVDHFKILLSCHGLDGICYPHEIPNMSPAVCLGWEEMDSYFPITSVRVCSNCLRWTGE